MLVYDSCKSSYESMAGGGRVQKRLPNSSLGLSSMNPWCSLRKTSAWPADPISAPKTGGGKRSHSLSQEWMGHD